MSDTASSKPSPGMLRKKASRSYSTKYGGSVMDVVARADADDRRAKLMSIIMQWSKNIFLRETVLTSKAFYRWKYTTEKPVEKVTETRDSDEHRDRVDQKSSYLVLFAENERLRDQLNETRKNMLINEKAIRASAVKSMITIILRSRLTSKMRYYYDIWISNTKIIKMIADNERRDMDVRVGQQRIDTERNNVRQTEKLNNQLKMTLMLTVFFYRWKSRAQAATLAEERKLYEQQRTIIYKDLLNIRETVAKANQQEITLLHNSTNKGEEISSNILRLREQLLSVVNIYKNTGDSGSVTNILGASSPGGVKQSWKTSINTTSSGGSSNSNSNSRSTVKESAPNGVGASGEKGSRKQQ